MQEVDLELYEKLTERLVGVNTAGKLGYDNFYITELPYMFGSWVEYRDYLREKIINLDKEGGRKLKVMVDRVVEEFDVLFDKFKDKKSKESAARVVCNSIVMNDFYGEKVKDFKVSFVDRYARNRKKEKVEKIPTFSLKP